MGHWLPRFWWKGEERKLYACLIRNWSQSLILAAKHCNNKSHNMMSLQKLIFTFVLINKAFKHTVLSQIYFYNPERTLFHFNSNHNPFFIVLYWASSLLIQRQWIQMSYKREEFWCKYLKIKIYFQKYMEQMSYSFWYISAPMSLLLNYTTTKTYYENWNLLQQPSVSFFPIVLQD